MLQRTLVLIKPDVCSVPSALEGIRKVIYEYNFEIEKEKTFRFSIDDAEGFYSEHRGRFFYPRLINFISSGPVCALVLARENAITEWRNLIGPSHINKQPTDRYTIRKQYAFSDTYNAVHGSDSEESAEREIRYIFECIKHKE